MIEYINLSKTLKEQYPSLAKKMPGIVIAILKKIIMQKEMNMAINKYIDYLGYPFTSKMVEELNLTLDIRGQENLPENGRCFFVANHLYGILDGMILGHIVGTKYGTFMGIGNDAFHLIPQLVSTVAAVNVYGKSAKAQILELDKIYKSDVPINHFPAGEVSRKYNGIIQDKEWQKSFITKAISEKRDIVPVYFHGGNSRLFYSVHSIRKFFGIKANVELMLLPRELFNKRNKKIIVSIGKPISYLQLDHKTPHNELAAKVRSYLYQLKNNDPDKINFV